MPEYTYRGIGFLACYLLLSLCLPIRAFAQATADAYVIATNFIAQGKVLELDVPPEMDGSRFYVAFQTVSGGQRFFAVAARGGRHCYEVRHFPEWQGPMEYVATTLDVQGRLKEPTLSDDLEIFLAPEQITPSIVNFVTLHTFFGWSFTSLLIVFFLIAAVSVYALGKKEPLLSMVVGFTMAWGLMDLRTVVDHVSIIYKNKKDKPALPPFTGIKPFADQASKIIRRSTWDHDSIDPVGREFLLYRLAEQPLPRTPAQRPEFWITQDPSGGQVVLKVEKYYLVDKNRR